MALSADSVADREAQLRAAELEISSQESQLRQELSRLEASAHEVLGRLQHVKAAASQAQLSGVRAPGFSELHRRVHQTNLEPLEAAQFLNAALNARMQAVEARRQHAAQLRQAIQSHAAEVSRLSTQLSTDESALTTFEAAAREEAARLELSARTITEAETLVAPRPVSEEPRGDVRETLPLPRRARPRVRMQAAVDLHSDSNFFTGFSTNISEGGLFVATVESVPLGTEVDLGFSLPGGQKISVKGVVRWTREVNDRTPEIFPGVGIQFVDLQAPIANALQQFVTTREPLFFPE